MKKIFITLMLMMLLIVNAEAAEVIIFHTNDLQAKVSSTDDNDQSIGLANISSAIKKIKSQNKNTLWFDAGDTFHGQRDINVSEGMNMVELLNDTPLDVFVPGNHDYNYGSKRLIELTNSLKATTLSANTFLNKKNLFERYKIYKLNGGIKVGVFGLTTPETKFSSNPKNTEGIEFANPIEISKLMVKELRDKCDILICVMHMGVNQKSEFTSDKIAKAVDGIDLIVDGHSHTTLSKGLKIKNTMIVQAGWNANKLGRVTIELDKHKIQSINAKLLDKNEVTSINPLPDENVLNKLNQIKLHNESIFKAVVTHSNKKLIASSEIIRRKESELGNLTTDAFKWRTNADIAVINSGALRNDLPQGDVTYGDILSIFPFYGTVQTVKVNGRVIREMLEQSVSNYPEDYAGFLQVSGLTFSFNPSKAKGQRVSDIKVNGNALNDSKIYTLATNDFILQGGDDYQMLKGLKIIQSFGMCEEILSEYLNKFGMKNINLGRIKIIN